MSIKNTFALPKSIYKLVSFYLISQNESSSNCKGEKMIKMFHRLKKPKNKSYQMIRV